MNWPFANFTYEEVCCPCCGELPPQSYSSIVKLQWVRDYLGCPIYLNSAHRCWLHNVLVRGAPLSMHKLIAFDIPVTNKNRFIILEVCKLAGFTGFGYYKTFLHVDCGRPRYWYGKDARQLWNG